MELSPIQRRRALGAELRRLRSAAGLSGMQLGAQLGTSQARVSRVETSVTVKPSIDLVTRWLDVVKADKDERTKVLRLAESVLTEVGSWQAVHRGTLEQRQRQLLAMDDLASEIRHFQPFLVPGPLQTPEYAKAVIEASHLTANTDVDAAVAARMERGERLRDPNIDGPAYHVVVTETAARWVPMAQHDVRLRQWAHLAEFAQAPRVTIQVIPQDAPMSMPPLSGFVWVKFRDYEEQVQIETPSHGVTVAGTDDLKIYAIVWEQMLRAALSPEESQTWLSLLAQDQVAPPQQEGD
ncbi:helix-turn-helix domain-containing protein [Nocardioides sp. NPDC057772]|uniref:helix-turn-helix domain-containing protein n=1 Tax=Nocardioides sp. NPDC057772 TaxID=3346245 RepID=UPI0036716F47